MLKVKLIVDGEMGLHVNHIMMEDDIVKHATTVKINGVKFDRTNLEYDEECLRLPPLRLE